MKVPQPNLGVGIVNSFIAKTGANRKLKKLWGTTTVDGVEVLHARRHYHTASDRPANYEKLFKFLKVYEDVKDYTGEGVKSAWFTLNKSNGPDAPNMDVSFFRNNLNRLWWDDADGAMPDNLTLTTTIVIGQSFNGQSGIPHIDWNASEAEIIQSIVDNYDSLWETNRIVQEGVGVINKGPVDPNADILVPDEDDLSPDDPWLSILSRNALRSSGVPCTIKKVEVGLGGVAEQPLYNTAVVTLEIPYHAFSSADPIVTSIAADSLSIYDKNVMAGLRQAMRGFSGESIHNDNGLITQSYAKRVTYYETANDIDPTTISRSYLTWENNKIGSSLYDSFWLEKGGLWYLKADVIDNPKAYGTTHTELNDYLFSLLDTGYKKKKTSVWKKIVAAIIFIVAVVITYISAGTQSTWTSQVMAAAYAVIVGALVISLITAVFGAFGMVEWATAFAELSKDIEPLVTVASIIMVVDVLSTAVDKIAEIGVSEFVATVITDMAKDFLTGLGDIVAGNVTSSAAINVVNKSVSVYTNLQANKLETLNSRNKDLKAEYEKLAEDSAMEADIMKGYMNIYAKPATADWSIYASTFDMPYERGGGVLAMGNVQKTTKKALRPGDYKEPMFEGLLLV